MDPYETPKEYNYHSKLDERVSKTHKYKVYFDDTNLEYQFCCFINLQYESFESNIFFLIISSSVYCLCFK